jgi:hypothetical protein
LGFAWLPQSYAQSSLDQNKLVPLNLATGQTREISCKLVLPNVDSAGPATKKLAEIIKTISLKAAAQQKP